jgi:fatty acid desaturase
MWVTMVIACYIHAVFTGFVGMESSVHELSHTTPFKTRWLNEFFYGLFAFLTWNNPVHFRESHRRHHQYTVFSGLDKEVIPTPAPFGLKNVISWFLFDPQKFRMNVFPTIAFAFGRDKPDVFNWDPLFEDDNPKKKKMRNWARFVLIGHIALIVVFAFFELWVLIYLISFSYFFATFLSRFCEITQHIGLPGNIPDWRKTAHCMIFGPFISFFYWRMNYHLEHHMYAAVPFYNLPKLHREIAHDTPEPVRGFWHGVRWIFSLMARQRKDPEWVYEPVLPASAAPAKWE